MSIPSLLTELGPEGIEEVDALEIEEERNKIENDEKHVPKVYRNKEVNAYLNATEVLFMEDDEDNKNDFSTLKDFLYKDENKFNQKRIDQLLCDPCTRAIARKIIVYLCNFKSLITEEDIYRSHCDNMAGKIESNKRGLIHALHNWIQVLQLVGVDIKESKRIIEKIISKYGIDKGTVLYPEIRKVYYENETILGENANIAKIDALIYEIKTNWDNMITDLKVDFKIDDIWYKHKTDTTEKFKLTIPRYIISRINAVFHNKIIIARLIDNINNKDIF